MMVGVFVDPSLPPAKAETLTTAARRLLTPGEQLVGLFAATRLRRTVDAVVVTSDRLLTLGLPHTGHALLDDLAQAELEEVRLDRSSVRRWGEVRARRADGEEVYLGSLTGSGDPAVLDGFEEALEQAAQARRRVEGGFAPPLPVPGAGTGGVEVVPSRAGARREPRVDPTVPAKQLASIHRAVRAHGETGEQVLGIFGATRWTRPVTSIVVTDRTLFNLGPSEEGHRVLDEVRVADLLEVRVERESFLKGGEVRAVTSWGEVYLGMLNVGSRPDVWAVWDEVMDDLDAARSVVDADTDRPGDDPGPVPTGGYLPLVAQLAELGRLHEAGLLTDEEFAAAKARVLQAP